MGITLNDIAAQRAMIERGEEKRKADWKLAERERVRDTFAAAALTGLLADDGDRTDHAMPEFTTRAYEWADAMLRERSRTGQAAADTTPQPQAGTNASEAEIDAIECVVEDGRIASMSVYGILRSWLIRLRPEWESQSYEEGNEKRTNSTMNRDATPSEFSVHPALTEAERWAIHDAVKAVSKELDLMDGEESSTTATLRNLLERLS
jgi:hypothetical protein